MNFVAVGDTVTHRRHGDATVARLLGQNGDDGIRVKLASGKMRDVHFTEDNPHPDGWHKVSRRLAGERARRHKTESRAAALIESARPV